MILAIAAVVTGGLLALLFVPITIHLWMDVGSGRARPPVQLGVGWAFLSWPRGQRPARKRGPPAPRAESTSGWAVLAALRTPGFLAQVRRVLGRTSRSFVPTTATIRATIGLDDPAQTGMLAGAVAAFAGVRHPRYDCRVRLDFLEPVFTARADVTWSVRPAVVLWPLVMFLLSPAVWRAVRAARRA